MDFQGPDRRPVPRLGTGEQPDARDDLSRAVRDRVVAFTPRAATELPKSVGKARTIATPEDFERLLSEIPLRWRLMIRSENMSPIGERIVLKDYPKDDQHRTVSVGQPLIELISADSAERGLSRDDLRFAPTLRTGPGPLFRNTFRKKVWLPALENTDLSFRVGVHDLRHAHASWLLAGGADLWWLSFWQG